MFIASHHNFQLYWGRKWAQTVQVLDYDVLNFVLKGVRSDSRYSESGEGNEIEAQSNNRETEGLLRKMAGIEGME